MPKLGQQLLHARLRELVINIWSRRTSVIASFAVAGSRRHSRRNLKWVGKTLGE